MFWPLVSGAGFVLAVVAVIALARARTARWEQERAVEEELVRRRRAQQRARSGMAATMPVRRFSRERPPGARTKGG